MTSKAPNAERILEAVERVEAACEARLAGGKGAAAAARRRSAAAAEPSPLWARALLFVLFAGYCAYAFGLGGVRAALGEGVSGAGGVDTVQKLIAVVCMGIISVVCLVGDGKLLA